MSDSEDSTGTELARLTVLRWEDRDPGLVPLLRDGGIELVLAREPDPGFAGACAAAGIRVERASGLAAGSLAGVINGGAAALGEGLWPGVSRGTSPGEEIASASRLPWVDANGFRIAWLAALGPGRPAILAYLPDEKAGLAPDRLVPYDTLELALIEARLGGGNYVLALEARFRAALLKGESRAVAAWRRLGTTSRWLSEHRELFGRPALPQITALVDAGEESGEIANLLFRQNASPALAPASAPPAPDPEKRRVLVAAGIAEPAAAVRARILEHARAGATVVGDGWLREAGAQLVFEEPDRRTFRLGRGRVVAYKEPIADPSDFALDVIDLLTHPRRAVRTWGGPAVIARATAGPPSGRLRARTLLLAVNYGQPLRHELLAYVQGRYSRAVLLRPEAGPVELKPAVRGTATEVTLPGLVRAGVVLLN